jgi:site-specific DNA-adenine methylase
MTNNGFKCYASDSCEDLIMLWKEVIKDTFKKPIINEKKWLELKNSKPSALRGYAGFGLSYSGQWFRAYSQNYIGSRNQNDESYNSIMKIKDSIKNVKFRHSDYKNHLKDIENGGYLIYCDPPYVNSLNSYKGSKFQFNSMEFWEIVKKWKKWGNIVVVSERYSPFKFECLLEKKLSNIDKTNYTEKLFLIT